MSSSDFTFITLRNISAYQPTGSLIPENYVLHMSTNSTATWTNSIALSTIVGTNIIGNTIIATDAIVGSTIVGSTIIGDSIAALSSINVGTSLFTTTTSYNYTGTSTISSILIEIGDNIWKIPVEFVQAGPL